VVDERQAELERLGISAADAEAWLAEQDPEDDTEDGPNTSQPLVIWPENWPVLQLFMRLQTQWRFGGEGKLLGLRYDAAEIVIRQMRMKKRRRLFDQLQEMEHEALEAWDEQQQH